jgi:hypothetical protein
MLEDVTPYPQSIEEFIQTWLQEKIRYDENGIITKVQTNGKIVKYHPVHPIGSPNRKYLERRMKEDLEYLISKYKDGVA